MKNHLYHVEPRQQLERTINVSSDIAIIDSGPYGSLKAAIFGFTVNLVERTIFGWHPVESGHSKHVNGEKIKSNRKRFTGDASLLLSLSE